MGEPAVRLGINIDHVATLRNARGGSRPDPVSAARVAIEAGAHGVTAHLREDRRHIRDEDVRRLLPGPGAARRNHDGRRSRRRRRSVHTIAHRESAFRLRRSRIALHRSGPCANRKRHGAGGPRCRASHRPLLRSLFARRCRVRGKRAGAPRRRGAHGGAIRARSSCWAWPRL